ncbi:MAG TPA: hypothetical protein VH743_17110 [Beijerinckiaceae bacterium]|jgi:hypothetical protein
MSALVSSHAQPLRWTWLRSARFDLFFILGLPALGVGTGALVIAWPHLFVPVLILDLWFLGYHHVISTYTRLCFDRKSFESSRFLVFGLLPLVAGATLLVAAVVGLWAIVSVYFYWQWFHYTRQSWGISRAYRGKDREALYEDGWLDQAIFYALPVLGILVRSHQDPGTFIGLELKVVPVPAWLVSAWAVATCLLLTVWLVRRMQAWRLNRLSPVHTLYMLSHFAIFAISYLVIADVTYGWLVINIWHNGQYILFVWLFNTRRFKDGVDPEARFLSYISQPHRLWLYVLTCIGITGVVYWAVLGTLNALFFAGLSATIVLYQIVNFHHYVVDSLIWKVRKAPIRQTLGLHG